MLSVTNATPQQRRAASAALLLLQMQATGSSYAESFRDYTARTCPWFRWSWHHEVIAEHLQAIVDGELPRLLIEMPPRYSKSQLVSRCLPGYFLRRHPTRWVGLGCANLDDIAVPLSKDARELFVQGGGTLSGDSRSGKLWRVNKGGGMWVASVTGSILGKGWDLGIIDDPFGSMPEAASPLHQERVWRWFEQDWMYRQQKAVNTTPACLVMHQRLHEKDLAGRLLEDELESQEPERWHILRLPAIRDSKPYVFPPSCTTFDDPRDIGDPLWPTFEGIEKLERARRKNPELFECLMQQNPQPLKGGGLFEQHCFRVVGNKAMFKDIPAWDWRARFDLLLGRELARPMHRLVRAWDLAWTKGGGDSTAGVLGVSTRDAEGPIGWLDAVEEKLAPAQVKELITRVAEKDGKDVEIVIPKDPSAGAYVADDLKAHLGRRGYRVIVESQPKGSKYTRATPHSSAARPLDGEASGKVWVMFGEWINRFAEVHYRFDGQDGGEDDLVDAAASAFNELCKPMVDGGSIYLW